MNPNKALYKMLKGKDIIVVGTEDQKGIAFALAHVLRNIARRTYCVDFAYKIKESKDGIRKIENGKVWLVKLYNDDDHVSVMKRIKATGGKIKYIFFGEKL